MALKKDVEAVLNKQLEKEFDAAVVYQAISIYFEQELLKGFAAWFKRQLGEERAHAGRIIEYMLDRGAAPVLPATKAPKMKYASPLEALKSAVAHERANTAGIYACLTAAQQADDPATVEALQWFVKEQVEEEKWADEYTQMLEKVAGSVGGLWAFDHRVEKLAKGE
jgi:ferritin